MVSYVLLRIEDDEEARKLIRDFTEYPNSPLLTPCQENTVYAVIEDHGTEKADE